LPQHNANNAASAQDGNAIARGTDISANTDGVAAGAAQLNDYSAGVVTLEKAKGAETPMTAAN